MYYCTWYLKNGSPEKSNIKTMSAMHNTKIVVKNQKEDDLFFIYKAFYTYGKILSLEWLKLDKDGKSYIRNDKTNTWLLLVFHSIIFHFLLYDSLPKNVNHKIEVPLDVVVQYIEVVAMEIIFIIYYMSSYKNRNLQWRFLELFQNYNALLKKYNIYEADKLHLSLAVISYITIPSSHVFLFICIVYLYLENIIHKTVIMKLIIGFTLTYKTTSFLFMLVLLKRKYKHLRKCFEYIIGNNVNCKICKNGNVAINFHQLCEKHSLRWVILRIKWRNINLFVIHFFVVL